ncbi:alpha/beta hydrolase family protein [Roseimaritima ulvae]|uniref:Palmitoyl-protein thioesterase ABHD10, mitochondrial n=1 Tax=Roseimaritima ulvae TaxID=980254 RepID=A0A5B9R689_9BACT|nr:alpha/beta fold hydrolase [Roseimaritima ulvae]QEG41763.1 Alpha/beta hydrolase family protein [Roseimaritima ulvae]
MGFTRVSSRVRFAGGNGAALAGIVDAVEGHPDAPLVLFSHCFTCNKDLKAIVRISRRLADSGLAVLRYDMTGLGGSEGDFSETNFTTNLADLRAAAAYAAEHLRPPSLLLGHSFGGAASLAAAATRAVLPALADVQAVVGLAAPADTQHLASLLSRMNPAIEQSGRGTVTIGGLQWTITQAMLDDFRQHQLADLIGQIELPILICHSPQDATVPYGEALRIMHLAGSSETPSPVSLLTIDGADHLLANNASDLTYVADAIVNFARRYTTPAA